MNHRSTVPLSVRVLRSYYTEVQPLLDYLIGIIAPKSFATDGGENTIREHLLRPDDSVAFKHMMTSSLVASELTLQDVPRKYNITEPHMHMLEVVDRAQAKLFKRECGKPSNIITSGYRSAERKGEQGKPATTRLGITNYFVNTIVTEIQSPDWELLLSRVGEDIIFHILTDTSIFAALPNDCFCQLTGPPLVNIKPPILGAAPLPKRNQHENIVSGTNTPQQRPTNAAEEGASSKNLKRTLSSASLGSIKKQLASKAGPLNPFEARSPADIAFIRARLFYARPDEAPKLRYIVLGLPTQHVLNRLMLPGIVEPDKAFVVDPVLERRELDGKARHLSKYVFPRQYGLDTVFKIPAGKPQSYISKIYDDRECEIKAKGACKTPDRLKPVLDELRSMLRKHSKCGYKPLLDKICPSKVRKDQQSSMDTSVILEILSEQSSSSSQLKTQKSDQSDHSVYSKPGGTAFPSSQVKHKPRFAEFTCEHSQVFLYARLITKLVIPKSLWGSDRNWRVILKSIKLFICARKYETLTLHNILQNFSTADCDWLLPHRKLALQRRISVSDSLKRRELLEEFIYWYFESFLTPLLRTTFYITESSAFRNKVLYFRQDDWKILCQPLLDRLTSATFQLITQHEADGVLRQRKLGFSFVRLLPKDTGVRPIVNLRRRSVKQTAPNLYDQSQSINQILQAAFQILNYEKNVQPQRLGASVFGPNEVYSKLKLLKSKITDDNGHMPKLWFVKIDVQACFDSIEQGKLLGILKELISEDAYMIHRYGEVASVTGRIRRTFSRKAGPDCEHPHFLTLAEQLAALLRSTILVDQVVYPFAYRDDVIQLLEDHITSNIVKIGQNYYRQIVGIPQGSVLSTLLCSYMYGHLENTTLRSLRDYPNNVLLRLVDDYLFISTDLTQARKFLETMIKGHPEYGCFISKEKTLTNFGLGADDFNVTLPCQASFPWCGYLIDMKTLSVSADYSRFHETYLTDSLTVERGRRPGATFLYKLLQMAKHKSHIIYCDTALNSDDVVYRNIYENFLLTAMKMHHYIRDGQLSRSDHHHRFIRDTIRRCIRYAYSTIRNKATNRVARESGARCAVQKSSVIWLGTHAFHTALSKKSASYTKLLKALEFDLSLPQNRKMKHRFGRITNECLQNMITNIVF